MILAKTNAWPNKKLIVQVSLTIVTYDTKMPLLCMRKV
jgi:hypothetical protein